MFSGLFISPYITLLDYQIPSCLDTKPQTSVKYKSRFLERSIHRKVNYTRIQICPVLFSRHSSFSTCCYVASTSQSTENIGNDTCYSDTATFNQSVDSITLAHLLQSCCSIKEVKRVHAVGVKLIRDGVTFFENNLISAYVNAADLVASRLVFDNMLERNVVSWTAMLNGYLRFGLFDEALSFFTQFVKNQFHWNSKTFVCVLNLCSRVFNYELGKQLHAYIIKGRISGLILDSALLYFYVQCGDLGGASRVFDCMENRDVVSWTTIITACSQHRQGEETFTLFAQMISDGYDPNEFTICSVLNACGEEKKLKFGRQLHGAIVKKLYLMDVFVGTSLVDMYAKCGEIEDARILFDRMKKRNTVTWTSIIAGYARNKLPEQAIRLFRLMQRQKIFANNLTMVSILRACGLLNALSSGKEVHAQILKNFSLSNIYIGSALVWVYCKCGESSAASKVLDCMPDKDVVSWTAMISGCACLGHEYEALEYLKEMLGEGVEPNPFTYSSVLKACAKLEDIKQGKLIHSSINKTPSLSNVFVGSALIHMYSRCGHLFEATQVFESMPERNLVAWKQMIVAYAKHGMCGEAMKLMYRMKAEGIEVDEYVMATVLTACGNLEWDLESSPERCLQS